MHFASTLVPASLIRRYNRFLADVRLEDGSELIVHCPNSGSMKTCLGEGWPVMLSDSGKPERKYRFTWEMVHNGKCWIGINTHLANRIVEEAILNDEIPELREYSEIRSEVKYGENSRIDLLLKNAGSKCFVEVKNVTMVEEDGFYKFPDSKTERGKKHLLELSEMVRQGHRAVMFFLVQRSDGTVFKPASHIDPAYASNLVQARKKGVEILVYRAEVSPQKILIAEKIKASF